jgi:Secretion system C-terminal sorting domain
MELELSGGPALAADVSLQSFGFDNTNGFPGGNSGNIIFFCSGAANSTEGQLFYTRPGTTVINNPSYTGPLPSSASLGIVLPLNWLSFNVVKQGNDGLLNWSVANDDDNHHYELQRSVNGTSDFKTIATVNKSASTDYKYTDAAINNLGTSILYYRIKQVDINGRTSYSDTRLLRLDVKGNQISVFPNPVKKGFYVNIPFNNSERGNVKLNLVGISGQLIRSRQITTAQASNYYFDIADMALAAGSYNLQIVFDEKIMETKKLNIIR